MALWAKIESISLFTFFSFHSYSRCLYWTSLDTFQEFPDSLCPVSSQVLLGNDRITISGASQKQNMCIHYISTMRLYYVCLTNIFFFTHFHCNIVYIVCLFLFSATLWSSTGNNWSIWFRESAHPWQYTMSMTYSVYGFFAVLCPPDSTQSPLYCYKTCFGFSVLGE